MIGNNHYNVNLSGSFNSDPNLIKDFPNQRLYFQCHLVYRYCFHLSNAEDVRSIIMPCTRELYYIGLYIYFSERYYLDIIPWS